MTALDQSIDIESLFDEAEKRTEIKLRDDIISHEYCPRSKIKARVAFAKRLFKDSSHSSMRASIRGSIFLILLKE